MKGVKKMSEWIDKRDIIHIHHINRDVLKEYLLKQNFTFLSRLHLQYDKDNMPFNHGKYGKILTEMLLRKDKIKKLNSGEFDEVIEPFYPIPDDCFKGYSKGIGKFWLKHKNNNEDDK